MDTYQSLDATGAREAVFPSPVPTLALAAAAVPDLIAGRQARMAEFNEAVLAIGNQSRAPRPDRAAMVAQADRIARSASAIPGWFPRGSGIESGIETEALPVIWQKPGAFVARASALRDAARELQAIAGRGTPEQLRAQAGAVDRACVACHRDFRLPD